MTLDEARYVVLHRKEFGAAEYDEALDALEDDQEQYAGNFTGPTGLARLRTRAAPPQAGSPAAGESADGPRYPSRGAQ